MLCKIFFIVSMLYIYLRDFASAEVLFAHMVNSLLLFQIDEFFESVIGAFAAQSLIRLREEVENIFESKGELGLVQVRKDKFVSRSKF